MYTRREGGMDGKKGCVGWKQDQGGNGRKLGWREGGKAVYEGEME